MKEGSSAPGFTRQTVHNETISLDDLTADGHHALLIFLRHLGCVPCREHVADLLDQRDRLAATNTRVLAISFSKSAEYGQRWLEETGADFPLVLDPERELYEAYQMKHSVSGSWSLETLWFYIKRIFSGGEIHGIQGDPNQLGGDVIVAPDGTITLHYPSDEAVDRPSVEMLFGVLEGERAPA
ncbi:MAG: AhpC/TSA family protein [Chloroflexi bacterium]|nr:AhpC/TSA family protein [Chloroflexota bacterium]